MLPQLPRIIFATAIGLFLFNINTPAAYAQHFRGHTPYQDPFFNLDSTPRTGIVSANGMYSTIPGGTAAGFASGMGTGACSGRTGPGSAGPGNGNCPLPTNAILRLRIDEDLRVEINGHPTKPQHLAGIHRGTRRFSLEGLEVDRVSPCDIVVNSCDEFGNPTRLVHTFLVQAGGDYVVHYPNGFEPFIVEQAEHPILPTMLSDIGYPEEVIIENTVVNTPMLAPPVEPADATTLAPPPPPSATSESTSASEIPSILAPEPSPSEVDEAQPDLLPPSPTFPTDPSR